VVFRKCLEGEEALQSKLSVFRILHPSTGVRDVRCCGHTPQDLSLSSGILASNDSIIQLCGDWDKIERRASAGHYNARDGHGVEVIKTAISTVFVVGLEGRYSICDNLSLCISSVGEGSDFDEYQRDEGFSMEKAHVHLSIMVGFTTNGERDSEVGSNKSGMLVEAEELQCLCGEVGGETILGGSGGEIKVVEVLDGGLGKGGIFIMKRRVENRRIDVVERWVWGREELVRREGQYSDVVRHEIVASPVAARLGRPYEIGHSNVKI